MEDIYLDNREVMRSKCKADCPYNTGEPCPAACGCAGYEEDKMYERTEEVIERARKRFADFVPVFKQLDGIQTLEWRHKSGTSDHYVKYVFDEEDWNVYISGDLGAAVISLTEKATLQTLSKYIRMIHYFIEKIECSTDLYNWDEDAAKVELRETISGYIDLEDLDGEELEEEQEKIYELLDDLIECVDRFDGWRLSDDLDGRLSEYDPDYYEWLYNIGKFINPRVIFWLVGMEMAYKILEGNEE